MKNFRFLISLLIIFSSFLEARVYLTPEEEKFLKSNSPLRLHNNLDRAPYNFFKNKKAQGFSIDYAKLLAKKLNVDITFKTGQSWSEIINMLNRNEIDVITNISKSNDYAKEIAFTSIFHTATHAIYVNKGDTYLDTVEKLENKTIVIPKGYFTQKTIQKYYPKIKQILVKDSYEALKYLKEGKADATIGKKNIIDHVIKTYNIQGIELSSYVDDNRVISLIRMGVSKDKEILRDILNKAIKDVSDAELVALKRKWFDKEYKTDERNFLNEQELSYLNRKTTIKMCNIKNLKPIEYKENDRLKGIAIDILNHIENDIGLDFEIIPTQDLEAAKKFLKEKKCDIVPVVTNVDDFIDIAKITDPYLNYKLAIITQKDKPVVSSLKSISDKRIAKIKDSQLIKILKAETPYLKVYNTNSNKETFEAVNKGDAYYALEPLIIASHYMSTYALNDLYISRYTNLSYNVSMAVREDDTVLFNILNKAISNIDENTHREFFNKWTSVSIKKVFDYSLTWKLLLFGIFVLSIIAYRHYILNEHNKKLQFANGEIEEKTKELAKQKLLFEKLYNKSSDGVLLIKDSILEDCNESTTKLLHMAKEDILDTKIFQLSPKYQPDGQNSKEKANEKFKEVLEEGTTNFEWQFLTGKDRLIWVEVVLTLIEIESNSVIHCVIRDITQRKVLEKKLEVLNHSLEDKIKEEIRKNEENTKKLIQQSRLAQMGEMISMIAHQWRQPLTAISATTNNLLLKMIIEKELDKDYFEKELNLITEYSQHLSLTIDDFRNFFKTNKVKSNFLIEDTINKSIKIIKTSLKSNNILLTTDFNCNENINSYSAEIQQVILNILKNSEDILIDKFIEDKKISIFTNTIFENDKKYCLINIHDNGGGIKEEIIDKVFDPYFSTKNEKDGTGLGLYMSKIIISDHCKGSLEVYNEDNGATFTIKLPTQIEEETNE